MSTDEHNEVVDVPDMLSVYLNSRRGRIRGGGGII